jgi:hypothetical protein
MSNYNFTREILGEERQLLAVYNLIKGYAETMTDPGMSDIAEIAYIYLDKDGTGDFIDLDEIGLTPSAEWEEELQEDILESLE